MTVAVAFPTTTSWNDRLYVIGGLRQDDSIYEWMQCYDVNTASWSVIKTLQLQSKGDDGSDNLCGWIGQVEMM